MHKLKTHYYKVDPADWWWNNNYAGFRFKWGWFRYPKGRHHWVSIREIDLLDEDGLGCTVRPRDPWKLPDCYEDRPFSRGRLKSWKDVTKKRKQWE